MFFKRRKELSNLEADYNKLLNVVDKLPAVIIDECYGSLNAKQVDGQNRSQRFEALFKEEVEYYLDPRNLGELNTKYEEAISK